MVAARDALKEFYSDHNLDADGGASKSIVWVNFFGINWPMPNTAARVAILTHHDLHHLVTGYEADEIGECEVGAWTLATGKGPLLGYVYDAMTMGLGLIRHRERTMAAWNRGREARNLYNHLAEELLEKSVEELRELAGLVEA